MSLFVDRSDDRIDIAVDKRGFRFDWQQLQRAGQPDQFVRRLAAAQPVEIGGNQLALAFAGQAAGDAAPQQVFLAFDTPAGEGWAGVVQAPQAVDTAFVAGDAEAGT